MKAQQATNSFVKETFMDLKTQLEITTKSHQASIQNLKAKFDKLADRKYARPSGSLPSSTQPNPRGNSSKPYQPPHARNEHVNAIFTQSGKSYDPPTNPSNLQNDSETPINFDSEDEDKESTPQPKSQTPKPVKETPIPKPYKPKIPYPQCLRKGKMEAQYGKFLDLIRAVRINVPFVDVLARIPNYGKFLKELVSNKHKLEQISSVFLSEESSAMIQNKVPPKLGEPGSLLILCNFNKAFSCNSLADLDFVILEMEEDSKVPLILGRPFLHIADEIIRFKHKQLNIGVGIERMIFHLDSAMKHSYSNDDTCFSIVIDDILKEYFDALLAMTADENSEEESVEEPPTDLKLKPLPDNLEYVFLEEPSFLPVIISSQLLEQNKTTTKDHFPFPFMDQMLERLVGTKYFCFLDGFSGYFQIPIDHMEQEETTFMCPFKTYAYWQMPFGLCNAPATFQRCMLAIFHDMIEESVEVFMDDFFDFGNSFDNRLNNLDKMLQHCKDENLVLNWEKCHFMVEDGIVLGHKVSGAGLQVDKAKIDVISKLPPLLMSKALELLEKDTPFEFDDECHNAFKLLKEKLTCAPVIVSPNWNLPFELMIDASDFAIGAVLGQKDGKHFHPIYFASKTLNATQQRYTVTEKELMVVVFAFDKF
ncbi:reverse transcriptase domain-containing protein [Tanacetum coccineum]